MSGLRERLAALAEDANSIGSALDEWNSKGISLVVTTLARRIFELADDLRALLAEDEAPATPDDVQALAKDIYRTRDVNLPLSDPLDISCEDVARAVLASDWLAEHDERIAMNAYERGLLDPGSAWMRANAEELAAARREGADAALAPIEALLRVVESDKYRVHDNERDAYRRGWRRATEDHASDLLAAIAQGRDAAKGGAS